MYKAQLIHEVQPGKFPEMKEWFKRADEGRRKNNPDYTPFKRYLTVYGSVHRVVVEFEMEKAPEEPYFFAEGEPTGAGVDFWKLIVPDITEVQLLKEIDLSD